MSKFLFSRKAVNDLDEIWDYTVKTWSENQAETYYLLLIESCKELAKNPAKGKSYDVVEKGVLDAKLASILFSTEKFQTMKLRLSEFFME